MKHHTNSMIRTVREAGQSIAWILALLFLSLHTIGEITHYRLHEVPNPVVCAGSEEIPLAFHTANSITSAPSHEDCALCAAQGLFALAAILGTSITVFTTAYRISRFADTYSGVRTSLCTNTHSRAPPVQAG